MEETHEGSSRADSRRRPGWDDIGEDARVVRGLLHARREEPDDDPASQDGHHKLAQHGIVSKARAIGRLA